MGAAPRPGASNAPPPSDLPETHAASGGMETTLSTGDEPGLPAAPLTISKTTARIIGSDSDVASLGTPDGAKRQFYGLYYNESAKEYRYRVAFPLWLERKKPASRKLNSLGAAEKTLHRGAQKLDPAPKTGGGLDRASLFAGLYYNRRSPFHQDDIVFPFFWNLRDQAERARTTVVGSFVNRRTKTETDDWLLPLYATGTRADGGYTVIPPLLTYRNRNREGGINILGPGYCKWQGGQSCDIRTASDIDLGVAPFYFFSQNEKRLREVIPPLGHYYRYDAQLLSWTNIYGPYFRRHTEKREMFHLIPFYFSIWGKSERHTTVAPLFHYGYQGSANLLITPLFLKSHSAQGHDTLVTLPYVRHRGDTQLDMVTPLFWHFRDRRIGLDRKLLLPFFYRNVSPRESTVAVLPFFSFKKRHSISQSLWVTPFFNYRSHLRGFSTAVPPLAFFGKNGHNRHAVVAPLFFDLKNIRSHTTFVPPLVYFRHKSSDTLSHLLLNVYYHERSYQNGKKWQAHLLPLLSFGRSPNGHFWNILFGLAGYKRQGPESTARVLWFPVPLSHAR